MRKVRSPQHKASLPYGGGQSQGLAPRPMARATNPMSHRSTLTTLGNLLSLGGVPDPLARNPALRSFSAPLHRRLKLTQNSKNLSLIPALINRVVG